LLLGSSASSFKCSQLCHSHRSHFSGSRTCEASEKGSQDEENRVRSQRGTAHLWLDVVADPTGDEERHIMLALARKDVVCRREEADVGFSHDETCLLGDLAHGTGLGRLAHLEVPAWKLYCACREKHERVC
jgi:hypothetical protein